jgi:uncharacterized protein (DUF2336 family)
MSRLNPSDVAHLLSKPSEDVRAQMAEKVAADYYDGVFGADEMRLAIEIFEIMVQDASERVRQALADHLCECAHLPRSLALKMAEDVDAVAMPVLRCSDILTDEDLLAIIRNSGEAKQLAITKRATISERVADSLIEQGTERVVSRVVAHPGAEVSERSLTRALDRFSGGDTVASAITRRGLIPMAVAERLIERATENLRRFMGRDDAISADEMTNLVQQVRERATLSLVDPRFGIGDAKELVATLVAHDHLTPSVIVRSLCLGDIAFFEAAMAHLAGLPIVNAMILVHDEGRRGLQALWGKAGMPMGLLPVVKAAVDVADELDYSGEVRDRQAYRRRVIERLLTQADNGLFDLDEVDRGGVDYLLGKLDECRVA